MQRAPNSYSTYEVRVLKSAVGNACRSRQACYRMATKWRRPVERAAPEPCGGHTLHLPQGARARIAGLHVQYDYCMNAAAGRRVGCRRMSFVVNYYGQKTHDSVRGALLQPSNTTIVVWVQHPASLNNLVVPRENQVRYSVLTSACQIPFTQNVGGTHIHPVSTYSSAKYTLHLYAYRTATILRPSVFVLSPSEATIYGTTNNHQLLVLQQ